MSKNNSTNINGAFNGCPKLYGGLGTPNKNIDRSFFKIDQGVDNPGLFTSKDKVEFVYIYVDDNEDEQVIREEYTFGSNVTIYDPMSSTFEIMTWTNVSNTKTYDPGAVINNARKGDTVYGRVSRLEYTHDDEITFDGTFYIDTGVYLFNNHDDFEVSFEVTQNYGMNNGNTKEATIFHAKRETVQNFWPGISIDVNNSASNKYNTKIRVSSSIYIASDITNNTGKFTILRVNDRIYLLVNGVQFGNTLDYSGYNTYFDSPATFGAAVKNPETMEMMRYWKGKIKNLHVKKGGPIDLSDYGL